MRPVDRGEVASPQLLDLATLLGRHVPDHVLGRRHRPLVVARQLHAGTQVGPATVERRVEPREAIDHPVRLVLDEEHGQGIGADVGRGGALAEPVDDLTGDDDGQREIGQERAHPGPGGKDETAGREPLPAGVDRDRVAAPPAIR